MPELQYVDFDARKAGKPRYDGHALMCMSQQPTADDLEAAIANSEREYGTIEVRGGEVTEVF